MNDHLRRPIGKDWLLVAFETEEPADERDFIVAINAVAQRFHKRTQAVFSDTDSHGFEELIAFRKSHN